MPDNSQRIALRHAFSTGQLKVEDGHVLVADNASSLLLRELKGARVKPVGRDNHLIFDAHTGFSAVVKTAAAERKIMDKYAQLGGKLSPLGLPMSSDMVVQSAGGVYSLDFRGGRIEVADPFSNDPARAIKMRSIEVWWTGLECRVRQEKVDEVYGGVAALIPGSGMSNAHKFPGDRDFWDMGPDGQRIIPVGVLLYSGPPMNLTLVGSLVEHDSGDIEQYKRKFAEVIANAARGLAAMAGVPAEAMAADQGFINDLSLGLVNGISSVLGADDDPYVPGQIVLHWADILAKNYTRQTLRRGDDPRTLDYTHVIPVTGVDQGGDRGEYAFYFDVRQFDTVPVDL